MVQSAKWLEFYTRRIAEISKRSVEGDEERLIFIGNDLALALAYAEALDNGVYNSLCNLSQALRNIDAHHSIDSMKLVSIGMGPSQEARLTFNSIADPIVGSIFSGDRYRFLGADFTSPAATALALQQSLPFPCAFSHLRAISLPSSLIRGYY